MSGQGSNIVNVSLIGQLNNNPFGDGDAIMTNSERKQKWTIGW